MFCEDKIYLAMSDRKLFLLPSMSNRHGLICGATGTGKTITLKVIAESFSDAGVPVFVSDIKGDLSGMATPGEDNEGMLKRIARFGLAEYGFNYKSYPTRYWDVFGQKGMPIRTTVTEIGPLLLSRILSLNATQEGVLNIIFRIADDQNLLLLDLKDLRAMCQFVGDNAKAYTTMYGNISTASIGAIQRGLLKLEEQGAESFFGEPALDIADWFQLDANGRGYMNILNCEQLFQQPSLYSTVLLWMLSELYERLPEAGDLPKPKMVFFFDEAHLLFNDAPKELLQKIEQVVRLIRSKGVGIFFITQKPTDVPDSVLSQLGNRIEHALRAYSPSDLKAVKTAAATFRQNPKVNAVEAIQQLGTGEALVQFLDEKGVPMMVEQAKILPPQSFMGPADEGLMQRMITMDALGKKYNEPLDRLSAYEYLTNAVSSSPTEVQGTYQAPGYNAPITTPVSANDYAADEPLPTAEELVEMEQQALSNQAAAGMPVTKAPMSIEEARKRVAAMQKEREKAQKEAEAARLKEEKAAEAARLRAEREAEAARIRAEKAAAAQAERERKAAEKEAERRAKEEAKAAEARRKELGKIASSGLRSFTSSAARQLARGLFGTKR